MQVAQVIETMAMGGAENLVVRLANNLADRGHGSHLIVLGQPGVLSDRIMPRVQVHYLRFERESIRNPIRFLASLREGYRMIRDVVQAGEITLVQTHLPGSNFLGLLLAWRRVCAVLATVHNNQEFNYGDKDNGALIVLRKWAYRRILERAQGLVAVSRDVKDSLISDLGVADSAAERIHVLANAVEIPTPAPTDRRTAVRARYGCDGNDVFLLGAGRFCDQKNFKDLLSAARLLKEGGIRFRLVIAGEGEQWSELDSWLRAEGLDSHVILPGNLSDLGEVMQAADIFVMSSLWEGLPLVLLEAMAAGLPIVAYAIPGVEEVVADGKSGRLVPVGRPAGLAEALMALAAGPALRQTMGGSGREMVRGRYNFKDYVDELVRQYDQAVHRFDGERR